MVRLKPDYSELDLLVKNHIVDKTWPVYVLQHCIEDNEWERPMLPTVVVVVRVPKQMHLEMTDL